MKKVKIKKEKMKSKYQPLFKLFFYLMKIIF
jgi:hypothetical protein